MLKKMLASPLVSLFVVLTLSSCAALLRPVETDQSGTGSGVGGDTCIAEVLSFSFEGISSVSVDIQGNKINVVVPFGTDVSALIAQIELPEGVSVSPDPQEPQDFTDPVTYTITVDGCETDNIYTVTVAEAPNSDATLRITSTIKDEFVTDLGIPAGEIAGVVDGSVTISAAAGADGLGAYITTFIPTDPAATVTRVVKYTDGDPTANFESDLPYANEAITDQDFFIIKVTGEDTTTVLYYKVIVTVTPLCGVAYIMTAGMDNWTGTACGDTITAPAGTLDAGDTIIGGAGIDTLIIQASVLITPAQLGDLSGIDVISMKGDGGSIQLALNDAVVDSTDDGGTITVNNISSSSSDTVDIRDVSSANAVLFRGADNSGNYNAIQVDDGSMNGTNTLNGGDGNTDAFDPSYNLIEVFGNSSVSIADLANVSNFGRIVLHNDQPFPATLALVLNCPTIDRLVDSGHVASVDEQETLIIEAPIDEQGGGTALVVDASSATQECGINATGGWWRNTLLGGAGNDALLGGDDFDTLSGGAGDDTLAGGNNWDVLNGGAGNDVLSGEGSFDILYGDDGDDYLTGGGDQDELNGGAGNDTLMGDDGNDSLYGGNGDDYIDGGAGRDMVSCGGGIDTVVNAEAIFDADCEVFL